MRYIQTFLLDFLVGVSLKRIPPLTLKGCQSLSLNFSSSIPNIVKFLAKPVTADYVVLLHVPNRSNSIPVFILFLSALKLHDPK